MTIMIATVAVAAALLFARDLAIVEDEVDRTVQATAIKSLEEVLPSDQARLIRALGSASPGVDNGLLRDLAEEKLVRMGRKSARALAWGTHVKDANIAGVSRRLLDDLYGCPVCDRTGEDPDEDDSDCDACRGTGDLRWKWGWEIREVLHRGIMCVRSVNVYVKRDLISYREGGPHPDDQSCSIPDPDRWDP